MNKSDTNHLTGWFVKLTDQEVALIDNKKHYKDKNDMIWWQWNGTNEDNDDMAASAFLPNRLYETERKKADKPDLLKSRATRS